MPEPLIQVVDEHDQPVGAATKAEIWAKGLLHRVSRIIIEDGQGRVLLQKRHPTKTLYPGRWDNSVAGHVDEGETYEQAAQREIGEEIGLHNLPLRKIGYYFVDLTWEGRHMRRFCTTYKTTIDSTPTQLGKGEVAAVEWFTPAELRTLVKEHPEQCSDGLRQVVERFYQGEL